ncbi:MAG TPA: tRNA preQ1(34) S-adenosylmethionine ribosyltransferase-isomerase QueA [Candidatus Baltobacteraceae bacterium]
MTAAYRFDLPEHLIAQRPAPERDGSRLMVLRGDGIEHRTFRDLPEILRPGDLLVLNETRVIAARLFGTRETGGKAEVLLLRPSDRARYDPASVHWLALARPGRKLRDGARILFGDLGSATVTAVHEDDGVRELAFDLNVPFETLLERAGKLPLPPYIHNDTSDAQERYQTVFARTPGSVAAPTASLHFTPELFERLTARGVETTKLVLDVGLGTFRPMQSERVDEHVMHAESYLLPEATVAAIGSAKAEGRRVIAVGTTVARALEGNIRTHGRLVAGDGETDIFISPGFAFGAIDAMITNFHLPQSTLLVLVSALAGRERILAAYAEAVARGYRFFSFGDAMLIEP